jgi:hypothetical protein
MRLAGSRVKGFWARSVRGGLGRTATWFRRLRDAANNEARAIAGETSSRRISRLPYYLVWATKERFPRLTHSQLFLGLVAEAPHGPPIPRRLPTLSAEAGRKTSVHAILPVAYLVRSGAERCLPEGKDDSSGRATDGTHSVTK